MAKITHGQSKNGIYKSWSCMIQRCENPNDPFYYNYGGRGIGVIDKWHKFENFYADMSEGYEEGLTIDRLDNELGYFKENCRWATRKQQAENTRIRKDNKTGSRGIYFRKDTGKYQLQIWKNGKYTSAGCYKTIKEAMEAKNAKS
jgi:hypothetical protein